MTNKLEISLEFLTAVEREACKQDFFEFVKSFWYVIIKEEPSYNWHIPFLCKELQELSKCIVARDKKLYDLIINIPPGTTKSTIVTIMFPAWLWIIDPTIRIITNSYSSDLSTEHAVKSRDIILSEKYKRLFPEVVIRRDKSGKESYENTATGARYTTSTGGTITGKHAHVIINDDPLNPKQAASDTQRKEANEHTKTLSSRKVNKAKTPTITIMQRLHESDVTGYLLSKKSEGIRHICLPAESSGNVMPETLRENYIGGLLDPDRLSREVLDEALVDLGSRGYAGQYGQSPVADGGNIVKNDWFQYISRADFERLRENEPIVFFGDTAFTDKKDENDPSGFIGTCKIGQSVYITGAIKVYKKFPDLIRFLPKWVAASGYTNQSTIRIEPKANGISVIDQLRDSTGLNVTRTPSPNNSKKQRLEVASPTIECGRVYVVIDHWNEDFIDEICGFPNKAHDEYVDLISYAIDYYINTTVSQDLSKFF
jgi:predicted phage terminase large subunit-like protein